jgi:hypothetical protein
MKSQYITNIKGKKISVILPIREYEKMIEQLEELEDIKAYDEAMRNNEEEISIHDALQEIESKRHDLRR